VNGFFKYFKRKINRIDNAVNKWNGEMANVLEEFVFLILIAQQCHSKREHGKNDWTYGTEYHTI
jgi:hypothetical protein